MLEGRLVRLRPVEWDDLPSIVRWMNDPAVTEFLLSTPIASLAEQQAWYQSMQGGKDRALSVVDHEGSLQGYCGITRLDWEDRQCSVWVIIGEKESWDRGYGTDALSTMLEHLFGELNLNRVYLTVAEENRRAIKAYERCGLRIEGTHRRSRFKNGRYCNDLTMAILREDWRDKRE